MKTKLILTTTILLSAITAHSFAKDLLDVEGIGWWSSNYFNIWRLNIFPKHSELTAPDTKGTGLLSEILSSGDGKQKIYFTEKNLTTYIYSEGHTDRTQIYVNDFCNKDDFPIKLDEETYFSNDYLVWNFNNQNVKMNQFCIHQDILDTKDHNGSWFLQVTALTESGDTFISNLFKKSTSNVKIRSSSGYIYNIPAKGFTKAWNSYGGDAI